AMRVQGAGAVVMAKTNVPQMLSDWQSNNPVYGRTNNPWDLGRTPGGSTGGGAAALAAGLTPLEFGSDIGGSIRVPAAFCGVYGHRPSETAMPRSGQFPMPPMPNAAVVMGVQGPMARSAEDLELALDVAAGPEVGEDVAWEIAIPAARRDRLAGFRLAVLPPLDWVPVDAWFGQREQYRAAWRAFFREWDVLLMPTFITPAYPHWDKPWPNTPESIRKTLDVNGKPVLEELGLFCASVATLAGQPSTAFP